MGIIEWLSWFLCYQLLMWDHVRSHFMNVDNSYKTYQMDVCVCVLFHFPSSNLSSSFCTKTVFDYQK